jgi:hypothetical protein
VRTELEIELETNYDMRNVGEVAGDGPSCYVAKSALVAGYGMSTRD